MGKVLLVSLKMNERGIRILGKICIVIELDLSEEGAKSPLLQLSSYQVSNSRAFIWNVAYNLAHFQISRYMMLVSSKIVPTRKHQENVPKDENH